MNFKEIRDKTVDIALNIFNLKEDKDAKVDLDFQFENYIYNEDFNYPRITITGKDFDSRYIADKFNKIVDKNHDKVTAFHYKDDENIVLTKESNSYTLSYLGEDILNEGLFGFGSSKKTYEKNLLESLDILSAYCKVNYASFYSFAGEQYIQYYTPYGNALNKVGYQYFYDKGYKIPILKQIGKKFTELEKKLKDKDLVLIYTEIIFKKGTQTPGFLVCERKADGRLVIVSDYAFVIKIDGSKGHFYIYLSELIPNTSVSDLDNKLKFIRSTLGCGLYFRQCD